MNDEQTEWKPKQELLTWAKQHFDSIPVNGVWSPAGSGVQYLKTDEMVWSLMSMYDTRKQKITTIK
jgi:hypothetical protein